VSGLTRERIDKKRWRRLGKTVRKQARAVDATLKEHKAIERALSGVPKLHLLERIERMANSLPPKWRKDPLELVEGAAAMITMRNEIVHGRMISDYHNLQIERLRANIV